MTVATARKKPASAASVRRILAEAVSEGYGKQYIVDLIAAAKGSEVAAVAECEACGKTMRVRVPDVKKQLDTLIALLEQGEGKAAQAVPEATTVIVERPAR